MLRFVTCLAIVLGVLAIAMPASATTITGVTATAGFESNPAAWMVNDNHSDSLESVPRMSDHPVLKTSTMDNDANADGMWTAESASITTEQKWLMFTFDNPTSLNEMVIWNGNQGYLGCWQRGLKDVIITYSTGLDDSGLGHDFYRGVLNHANGTAGEGYTNDLFLAGGPAADVKAVKLVYTTNFHDGTYAYNATAFGLSEVLFDNGVSTPEPGTIVLLTTGLIGLLAYAWRKRK